MDIFDIFWTLYLNHLSPLWGYYFQANFILVPFHAHCQGVQAVLTVLIAIFCTKSVTGLLDVVRPPTSRIIWTSGGGESLCIAFSKNGKFFRLDKPISEIGQSDTNKIFNCE